jgi:hypothetical protein
MGSRNRRLTRQSYVKVVDPKEKAVARLGVAGLANEGARGHPTCEDKARPFHPSRRLPEVGVGRSGLRQPSSDLPPQEQGSIS